MHEHGRFSDNVSSCFQCPSVIYNTFLPLVVLLLTVKKRFVELSCFIEKSM